MAAYAALLSLAQNTLLNTDQDDQSLFSPDAVGKLRSIHEYVSFLLSFFEESPQQANRWEGRIRDVGYEIGDVIELFVWQRIQSPRGEAMVRLGDQLKNATEEIGFIAGAVMEERPAHLPPPSSPRLVSTRNDAVIGLDEDLLALKDRLCGHSSKQLQVIPIVGMGGIGKSTLAKTLYEDRLIIETFHVHAFVVVSQDYNPLRFRRILLDLLKLLEEEMSGDRMDVSDIQLKVFKNLKGRRYLVVLDDVWGTDFWDDVRHMFPNDSNGSRIMLTTRQLDVATYPYSAGPVHEMGFMNDSQSWDLLKQKVFGNRNCLSELEEAGKKIARRCAGLPLAIVLVAGILSQENSNRALWEEIAENVNPAIGREVEEMVSLSYTYLPHCLRPCFLYIGGFLEDASIRSSRLIRLWVAEGFVKRKNGCRKSLEEQAEEYLEDLVKRNLVIVTNWKSDGKIKSCSLHDMVRGSCIRKAEEEKFLRVMDGRDVPRGFMNERRISFRRSDIDKIWGPSFHTILCFQTQDFPSWLALLGNYKLLRVLDVLYVQVEVLPSEVFELYHLRYLALTGSFHTPSVIPNLVNLQTVIIHLPSGKLWGRYGAGLSNFSSLNIWRIPRLRHAFFHTPYILPHPQSGLDIPLENLRTLGLVKNLVWNEKIIQMVPNVKRLRLAYTVENEYQLHFLKDLYQLEKLEVIGYEGFSWRGKNPCFPCTLKKLVLVGGGLPQKDMALLGSLPNLEVLKLLGNAYDGETWTTCDGDFPRLKCLLINGSPLEHWASQGNYSLQHGVQIGRSPLKQWITEGSPFPSLKRLVLRSLYDLRKIPEGIGEIATLDLIEVDRCTASLVESAKKIKENQESYGNCALQVRVGHKVVMKNRV